jgi:hypothetical protein
VINMSWSPIVITRVPVAIAVEAIARTNSDMQNSVHIRFIIDPLLWEFVFVLDFLCLVLHRPLHESENSSGKTKSPDDNWNPSLL